jgi:hypothetical protein
MGVLAAGEGALGLAVAIGGFAGLGRRLTTRAMHPETALVAGWGAFCLVMTGWAVALPLPLSLPVFALAALLLFRPHSGAPGVWPAMLLAAPLILILLFARPSQVDTWLNLLPNLAYIFDHGQLPADGGPNSWSFLPAAPYNTQFAGLVIAIWGGFGQTFLSNALSLFNAALLCAAGLHFARLCDPTATSRPVWWAAALGLLIAIPLNPGFVPRVFFASYGEAPIAVTLLFATVLGADLFAAARAGIAQRSTLVALALVLSALVEIKQSALGLLLPFSATLLVLGLIAPGMPRVRWAVRVAAATAPALLLYALYRWYVLTHFAVGELKMLPFAEWHLNLLPQIAAGIAFAIFEKATYFLFVVAVLAGAVVETMRRPWQRASVVLLLGAGLIAGFTAFLLFTYVAHFPAVWAIHAHSYFRYMSQLSLVVMLGLVTWLRPGAAAWVARRSPALRRRAAIGVVAAVVLLPVAGYRLLRFDLAAPQPFLWDIAQRSAALLHDGDRLALVAPGDGDDAVGSLLRGVLLFTPPRRHIADFRTELSATPASLDDALRAGFTRALVTCAPHGLASLPSGNAGLLAYADGSWHVQAKWPLPDDLAHTHFSAMLPREPFCPQRAANR